MLFGENETIQLKTFGCSLILYRTFKRHCKENKFFMAEEEFMKVYEDPHLNSGIVNMIDSFVFNSKEEIESAAEIAR